MNQYILVSTGSPSLIQQAIVEHGKLTYTPPQNQSRVRLWVRDDGSTVVELADDAHAYDVCYLTAWIPFHVQEALGSGAAPSEDSAATLPQASAVSWFSNSSETFCFTEDAARGAHLVGVTQEGRQVIFYLPDSLLAVLPDGDATFVEPPQTPARDPDLEFEYSHDDPGVEMNPELSEYSTLEDIQKRETEPKGCLPLVLLAVGATALAAALAAC